MKRFILYHFDRFDQSHFDDRMLIVNADSDVEALGMASAAYPQYKKENWTVQSNMEWDKKGIVLDQYMGP